MGLIIDVQMCKYADVQMKKTRTSVCLKSHICLY